MTFRRKLFTLLSKPRDGGGGSAGLSDSDVDFVIELIERQNEIDKELTEAEKERERESGQARDGSKPSGSTRQKNPCDHLRARLSQALKDGDYALADSVSRTYMECRAEKKLPS